MSSLAGRRVMVTGGGGFLGTAVVARLKRAEPAAIAVPRSRDYDLRHRADIDRAIDDHRPDVVRTDHAAAHEPHDDEEK